MSAILELIGEGAILVALISGLPLALSSLACFFVSLLQALLQTQEQSLLVLVRLTVVTVVYILCYSWFSSSIVDFVVQSLGTIEALSV